MEEDERDINSPVLERNTIKKQLDLLKETVDEAQKRIDYTVAHDEEIRKAIRVVERFLRKKKRVCYGGQAINALLPKSQKFYDEKFNLPDYDFFSPNPNADVDELIEMLLKDGFADVNKKVGVHEGTMKVYVNYIPVADCSEMEEKMFKIIQKRAHSVDGILYCDPDFLRMMMYLELSRPRGEVDRWKKVYERLTLLNKNYPQQSCDSHVKVDKEVFWETRKTIYDFIVKVKGVVCSPEIIEVLSRGKPVISYDNLIQYGGPIIFLSDSAKQHAEDLKDILNDRVKVDHYQVASDSLFPFSTITKKGKPIIMILQEEACHGYTQLTLSNGGQMRLAMPDLLLHIYYSFMIFGKKEKTFFQTSLECLINKIHSVANHARKNPTSFLPAFSLRCSGKQKGMATLLKEKQVRTEKEKEKKKKGTQRVNKNGGSKTRKYRERR